MTDFTHDPELDDVEAWEPWRRFKVRGKFVRRLPHGVTFDDARGVRWFALNDRVITAPDVRLPSADHGTLW